MYGAVSRSMRQATMRQGTMCLSSLARQANHGVPASSKTASVHSSVVLTDIASSFRAKPTNQLMRAYVVLTLCKFPLFVRHSLSLIELSRSLFGKYLTNAVVKHSFFAHFVGGETETAVVEVSKKLHHSGVGTIWNFAAEAAGNASSKAQEFHDKTEVFLRSIRYASDGGGQSFIAMKLTAIFDSEVLQAISSRLKSAHASENTLFADLLHTADVPPTVVESSMNSLTLLHKVCALAREKGVSVLIDAEQLSLQPAILLLSREFSLEYNRDAPVVYTTYQMYLKEAPARLVRDLSLAADEKYHFAGKVVRGAYMQYERAQATLAGTEDPIWPSLEATHHCYDEAIETVLSWMTTNPAGSLLLATHNQSSVEKGIHRMRELQVDPARVSFGQLYGMKDHITFGLGSAGYQALKLIPYGKIDEVLPYLVRRANENSDIMSGVDTERQFFRTEILRRAGKLVSLT